MSKQDRSKVGIVVGICVTLLLGALPFIVGCQIGGDSHFDVTSGSSGGGGMFGNGTAVAAGWMHTMALKTDGTLWAWGTNGSGQLGLGHTVTNKTTPNLVTTATDWTAVDCGQLHTVALKTDGTLWTWGNNEYGQLGLGSFDTNPHPNPAQIGSDTDWSAVACGGFHTLAIKTTGALWAWGRNDMGQLGVGDTTQRLEPTQVGTDTDWIAVAGGLQYTMALRTDGSLWAWGINGTGQLGLGDLVDKHEPTQVGTDKNWSAVACGFEHTIARKTNSTLWAWGRNSEGQLGLGHTTDTDTPTSLPIGTDWSAVAVGAYHTVALKTTGTLWAWGWNEYGQLGLGSSDTNPHPVPTQVGTDTDWAIVMVGGESAHTLVIKTTGAFWAWGCNIAGQLGLGDTTNRDTPTQVGQ